jgi:hypothetical protein
MLGALQKKDENRRGRSIGKMVNSLYGFSSHIVSSNEDGREKEESNRAYRRIGEGDNKFNKFGDVVSNKFL